MKATSRKADATPQAEVMPAASQIWSSEERSRRLLEAYDSSGPFAQRSFSFEHSKAINSWRGDLIEVCVSSKTNWITPVRAAILQVVSSGVPGHAAGEIVAHHDDELVGVLAFRIADQIAQLKLSDCVLTPFEVLVRDGLTQLLESGMLQKLRQVNPRSKQEMSYLRLAPQQREKRLRPAEVSLLQDALLESVAIQVATSDAALSAYWLMVEAADRIDAASLREITELLIDVGLVKRIPGWSGYSWCRYIKGACDERTELRQSNGKVGRPEKLILANDITRRVLARALALRDLPRKVKK